MDGLARGGEYLFNLLPGVNRRVDLRHQGNRGRKVHRVLKIQPDSNLPAHHTHLHVRIAVLCR